jgi:hypothetical protein
MWAIASSSTVRLGMTVELTFMILQIQLISYPKNRLETQLAIACSILAVAFQVAP